MGVTKEKFRSRPGHGFPMHLRLQKCIIRQHTSSTSWVEILEIISFSMNHLSRFRMAMCAHTCQTATTQYAWDSMLQEERRDGRGETSLAGQVRHRAEP